MDGLFRTLFYIVAFYISGVLHEQAHAWVAWKLGDPTGKNDKRLTWHPLNHFDPFMSLILPLITFFTVGFPFGGPKPVYVNPDNFERPAAGWALSAAAGPVMNIALAGVSFGLLAGIYMVAPGFLMDRETGHSTYNAFFLTVFFNFNVMLAGFNLLPLPMLDGSRVLRFILPRGGQQAMDRMEPYAVWITVGLVALGITALLKPLFRLEYELYLSMFVENANPRVGISFVHTVLQQAWGTR